MPTSGNVPGHLIVAARTGFLTALPKISMPWQRIASQINMDAKSIDLVDLGAAPMPTQNLGKPNAYDFIEKRLTIVPRDWDVTVWITYNSLKDDQTGTLDRKVRSAGENFQRHINNLVFAALEAGTAATYGNCYDGGYFFRATHKDKGAVYQTSQSNTNSLAALSPANFNTVYVAAASYLDDQGEPVGYEPNLLVIPPALVNSAAQITGNPKQGGTANNDVNPFNGKIDSIISPKLASTSWYLLAASESAKPMLVAMRENPNLQDTWFDPKAADGGRYYFKFYARYDVFYGDWRLATKGN